jgi:hypothetical protein
LWLLRNPAHFLWHSGWTWLWLSPIALLLTAILGRESSEGCLRRKGSSGLPIIQVCSYLISTLSWT